MSHMRHHYRFADNGKKGTRSSVNSLNGITTNIALSNLKDRSTGAKNSIPRHSTVTAADVFNDRDNLDNLRQEIDHYRDIKSLEAGNARSLKTSKSLLSISRYLSMGLSAGIAAAAVTAGVVISPFIAPLAAAALLPAYLVDKLANKKLPELSEKIAEAKQKEVDAEKHCKQIEKRETSLENALASKEEALLNSSPTHDTSDFLAHLSHRLGSNATPYTHARELPIAGSIPTTKMLQEAFAAIKEDKSIPWEHISDGCYARAHTVCEKLLREGIGCGKLFVTVPDDSNGYLKAKNRFQDVEWWYHVSPLVFVKDEKTGNVEACVIDLAINDKKPIKAETWIRHFWDRNTQIHCYATPADIYDGEECSPSVQDATFSFERFADNIKNAESTNKSYLATLNELKSRHYASA